MKSTLVSFDGTESCSAEFLRPDRYRHLFSAFEQEGPSIARGAGLSYCNASAGDGVRTVSTLAFDRVLEFDREQGRITVEPGMALGRLCELTFPAGWFLPVLPGHPSITVGGSVGCNVHGKNQARDGTFYDWVESLVLYHPDHGEFECSRECEPDIFDLTVGGFGLTGLITSVTLRLKRIGGTTMVVERTPVADLVEAADVLRRNEGRDLVYSWHDFNARGDRFGSGFAFAGEFANRETSAVAGRYKTLRPEERGHGLRGLTGGRATAWVSATYRTMQTVSPGTSRIPLFQACFPICGKEVYFHLFGRRGFREYQFVVPHSEWSCVADRLRTAVAEHDIAVGLASLKLFGRESGGLRFDGEGICLAIDVANAPRSNAFFAELDRIAVASGSRVNIGKDSRLSTEIVSQTYESFETHRNELRRYDPKHRFGSTLRSRLSL